MAVYNKLTQNKQEKRARVLLRRETSHTHIALAEEINNNQQNLHLKVSGNVPRKNILIFIYVYLCIYTKKLS